MEINGKYLGWSIIHLILFTYMVFVDFGANSLLDGIFLMSLMLFFGWRFVENMEKTFPQRYERWWG